MKERITMFRVRFIIQVFMFKNIGKWVRWQRGGMTEVEKQHWRIFLGMIEKKYGYRANVPMYESAK